MSSDNSKFDFVKNFLYKFKREEYSFMIFMGLVVGVITGLFSTAFITVLSELDLFLNVLAENRQILYFIMPAVGGLLVGPIIRFVAPEAKEQGVTNVILAISIHKGKIKPIVVLSKAIASVLTIGSGGSAGREGPIVQIASGIASAFSQMLGLNERRTIVLLASGAAAGISATFNAPIAGAIFATEIIMKKSGVKDVGSILIASVSSSIVARFFLGERPAFSFGALSYNSSELPLFILLGGLSALIALTFTKLLCCSEWCFDKLKLDFIFKPAIGGLLCGAFLYFAPEIYGTGFIGIAKILDGAFTLKYLLLLLIAKMLATSFTLGSGGSGGVFGPLLFIGAVFGALLEKLFSMILPFAASSPGLYAVVGMAAVFAATTKSPLVSVILIFELSKDYNIIFPLILSVAISTILSHKIFKMSIYTCKLASMGVNFEEIGSKNLLENINVEDAMIPESHLVKVPAYMPIRDLEAYFYMKNVKRCIVIDSFGELFGMVNIKDLYRRPDLIDSGIVADICSTKVVTMRSDDSLEDAAMVFGSEPYHTVPVVDSFNSKKVVGLLRREDIISAYSNALKNKNVVEKYLKSRKIQKTASAELLELRISSNYKCVGKKISDLKLPDKCTVVTIFRNKEQIIPDDKTKIEIGDNLIVICNDASKVIKVFKES